MLLPAITEGLFYVIEGKLEGNAEGKQEFLLDFLESRFTVPSELREKISAETNPNKLKLCPKRILRNLSCGSSFRLKCLLLKSLNKICEGSEVFLKIDSYCYRKFVHIYKF